MKLLKRFLTVTLVASMLVTNVFASVTQPTLNKDTFTFENITRTMGKSVLGSIIITGTNTARVLYDGVWRDCILSDGSVIKDIVRVSASKTVFTALSSNGDAFIIGGRGEAVKYTIPDENIVDLIAPNTATNLSCKWIVFLTEKGNVYQLCDDKLSKVDSLDGKATQIFSALSDASCATCGVVLNDGSIKLLRLKSNTCSIEDSGLKVKVSRLYPLKGGTILSGIVQTETGEYMYLRASDGVTTRLILPENVGVLSAVGSGDNRVFLNTTDGLYVTVLEVPVKVSDNRVVVSAENGFAILDDGKYYNYTGSGATTKFTLVENYGNMCEWVNTNQVAPDYTLAKFDIPYNKVYAREESYKIKFSLVSDNEPKAFNLYYTNSENYLNRGNWKLIESDVDTSKLNCETYETGYTNADGIAINGKTYTYNWVIPDEDLVGIKFVAEPTY